MDRYRPYDHRRPDRARSERRTTREGSITLPLSVIQSSAKLTDKLFQSIRYDELRIDRPAMMSRQDVFAHALMYIELLKFRRIRTKPEQAICQKFIHDSLKEIVPIKYFVRAGCQSAERSTNGIFRADQTFTLIAARAYIEDLIECRRLTDGWRPSNERHKVERQSNTLESYKDAKIIDGGTMTCPPSQELEILSPGQPPKDLLGGSGKKDPRRLSQDGQYSEEPEDQKKVTRLLDKIEIWITLWLKGRLNGDEDWHSFNRCMTIPDQVVDEYQQHV